MTEDPLTLGKRRSAIDIMTNLLKAARQQRRRQLQTDGGVSLNKRQLMRSANLNHSQLSSYLDILESKGFVIKHESEGGLDIETTAKGEELLTRTEALADILN